MNKLRKQLLSIVVPCFNDESVISITHNTILETLGKQDFDIEIVYINDGSSDSTLAVLLALAQTDNRVSVLSFSRNFGQQQAITAGLKYAKGDAVGIMDSDLQDPPEVFIEMMKKLSEGFQVVYGVRKRRKESLLKRFCYSLFYKILRMLSNVEIPLDSGDFGIMDRKVVDILNALPERNRFVRGLRAWCGFSQCGVDYERSARVAGQSYYSLSKTVNLAMNGLFNFSVRPLSFISLCGFFASMLSFVGAIFFVLHRLIGFKVFGYTPAEVPGFTSVILSLLFFSGVQLMSIGILGEYIGRLYEEVKQRPLYLVDSVHDSIYISGEQNIKRS